MNPTIQRIFNAIPLRPKGPAVTTTVPLTATIKGFTAPITGLGTGPVNATRPYLMSAAPRPMPRVQLSGLLIPPKLRRGVPVPLGSPRTPVRKGV